MYAIVDSNFDPCPMELKFGKDPETEIGLTVSD